MTKVYKHSIEELVWNDVLTAEGWMDGAFIKQPTKINNISSMHKSS